MLSWNQARAALGTLSPEEFSALSHSLTVRQIIHGVRVKGAYQFRVTRNSELYLDEEETDNLLKSIELELRKRNRGAAVRLEVQRDCPRHVADQLLQTFGLTGDDIYQVDGPINFLRLMPVISEVDRPTSSSVRLCPRS